MCNIHMLSFDKSTANITLDKKLISNSANEFLVLPSNKKQEEIRAMLKKTFMDEGFWKTLNTKEQANFILEHIEIEEDILSYYCLVKVYAMLGAKYRLQLIEAAQAYKRLLSGFDEFENFVLLELSKALASEYEFEQAMELAKSLYDRDIPGFDLFYSKLLYQQNRLDDAIVYLKSKISELEKKLNQENKHEIDKKIPSLEANLEKYQIYKQKNQRYIPQKQKGIERLQIPHPSSVTSRGSYEIIDAFTTQSYVALDFEATSRSYKTAEIIEIGALKVIDGVIIDRFECLVKPIKRIPNKIIEITSITNEMVKDANRIQNVLPAFLEFIGDLPLLCHKTDYDVKVLLQACALIEIHPKFYALDTLLISKKYSNLKIHNLGFLCAHYQISHENAHRAAADVRATHELYQKMYQIYAKN